MVERIFLQSSASPMHRNVHLKGYNSLICQSIRHFYQVILTIYKNDLFICVYMYIYLYNIIYYIYYICVYILIIFTHPCFLHHHPSPLPVVSFLCLNDPSIFLLSSCRFHTWKRTHSTSFPDPGSLHLAWWSLVLSIFLSGACFCSFFFFLWLNNTPL